MKKFALLLSAFFSLSILYGQIPSGYYDAAQGQSGAQLKTTLYTIINAHNERSYAQLWSDFQSTDKKSNGKVWDMYSDVPGGTPAYEYTFVSDQCGTYSGEGSCYNREHSFPKSWFSEATPMYTDLFHLYPTDGYVNGRRSNYPYGEVSNPSWTSTNGSKLGPNSTQGYSGTVFEPIDEYKGDLARTYFYMVTCYENVVTQWNSVVLSGDTYPALSQWTLDILLKWNNEDPVSQKEVDRNNAIYNIQNNRNPFIDHPEYVSAIWGNVSTAPIIANIYTQPIAPSANESTTIYATVTDDNGTVTSVTLNWGLTSGALTNQLSMNANGSEYSATIPGQAGGATVYYTISATDNDAEVSTSSEYNYTVITASGTVQLPIYEDFENGDMGVFTAVNIIGAGQSWVNYSYAGNLFAKMSGWDGSGAAANEDWLVSPQINFDNYTNESLSFKTSMNYPDDGNTSFQILYSTNYAGSGDPNQANWNDLSAQADWSTGDYVWVESGSIDLSAIQGTSVSLAFKYANDATAAETWQLDDISVSGTAIQTGVDDAGTPQEEISLFPNPSQGIVQIKGKVETGSTVFVYNYLGQVKYAHILTEQTNNTLQLQFLKPGIYILQLKQNNAGTSTYRLLIQ